MLTWLLTTKIGRWVSAASAAVLAVSIILWRVFTAGKSAERQKAVERTLDNLKTRSEVEDEVNKMSSAAARDELRKWVSDDK